MVSVGLWRRNVGGDGPVVGRSGLLLQTPRRQVLHPGRNRARRIRDGGGQQHLHESDGPGEPEIRSRDSGAHAG